MSASSSKQFYRSFFSIVVPIAIQQLISASVGVADTLMLGYVSQTALAASWRVEVMKGGAGLRCLSWRLTLFTEKGAA